VTASGTRARGVRTGSVPPAGGQSAWLGRPLLVTGTIAACVVTASGLAVIALLVLIGWIAAPHGEVGLPAVLRAAPLLWLTGQHVDVTLRGAGRIGMLPLGLLVLPGALLWRAGRWMVRVGQIQRLRHLGYAVVALAVPYSALTGTLALVSRSAAGSSSVPEALICGLLLAAAAGTIGGARALASWPNLMVLLPGRVRFCVLGVAGILAVLIAGGALLAGAALAAHLRASSALETGLAPGSVGVLLLLLIQLSYLPNAVVWAISFALGPGFAFGDTTVIAPTGSALLRLPAFPMLAAMPSGLHSALPGWLGPVVLAVPYLAGGIGGLVLVRAAPALTLDGAPLCGLGCGAVAGAILAVAAALSGGPLGDGRLAAVGPSGWQVAIVAALELGLAAAISAGASNFLALRRAGALATAEAQQTTGRGPRDVPPVGDARGGHVIYLNSAAGDHAGRTRSRGGGPSALP
jgi:Family of unknown function (DUF6350)